MSILQAIKNASLEARKRRDSDAASALVTLYSEAAMKGKNAGGRESTDEETIEVVKKFIKNVDDFLSAKSFAHSDPTAVKLLNEKALYTAFLPKQMDEAEIRAQLLGLKEALGCSGPKSMGLLLKEFKAKFNGLYNGEAAAKIAKEIVA